MAPVADRFDGLDTSTPSKSFQAVKTVENDLKAEIQPQADTQAAITDLEKTPGYDDAIRQKLKAISTQLKAGQTLTDTHLSNLDDIAGAVGNTKPGGDLVNALTDYNNLNRMKQIGNYNPQTKTFGGGISGTAIGQKLMSMKLLGMEGAGDFALHMAGYGLGLPPGAITGAGLGLAATARSVDKLLGNRNLLDEFTSRFGSGDNPVPIGPVDTGSVDQLLNPQGQQAGANLVRLATQAPSTLGPTVRDDIGRIATEGLPNYRDILNQRKLSQSAMDRSNAMVDNGVSSIAKANVLKRAQEAAVPPTSQATDTPITGDP